MDYQPATLLAFLIVPAFLAHAYYRWRSDFLRKIRGPDSSSFLYGERRTSLLIDSRGSLVEQVTNVTFALRRKWGIASSNGLANMAKFGDDMGALA